MSHSAAPGIGRKDFDRFRLLIRETCGISLGDSKDALLSSRLGRRMRELGIRSHADYYEVVVADKSGLELQRLVDAVSTNVTSFFREPAHFDILGEHLARIAESGQRQIRLWSAACSTGEEPYSMAITAAEKIAGFQTRVRILATDISTEALQTARQARYAEAKAEKMSASYATKHLRPKTDGTLEISPVVRQMVAFSPINLAHPPFPMKGPFDAVFCRNVMIYFDAQTRHRLIAEIERLLAPGGLLMLGHAESLAGIRSTLKPLAPAVYQKARR